MQGLPFNVTNIDDALIFKGINEVKLINSSVDLINNTGYVNAVQKLFEVSNKFKDSKWRSTNNKCVLSAELTGKVYSRGEIKKIWIWYCEKKECKCN